MSLQQDGYLSIKAGVAEDLIEANEFWERQHFYVSRRKDGGQTTGRKLLVRIHELDTPQLFARSGLAVLGNDSLGLKALASESPPMYLVDLNILFDIVKRRPQHDAAASLFRAAHSGECRLAISDEMGCELQRSARDSSKDPMLCLIESLPTIPLPGPEVAGTLEMQLSGLIFPEKTYPSQLSANDLSDVRHVTTAVYAGLSGFITRDNAVLQAASAIESLFGVQIVSPEEFRGSEWAQGDGITLDLGEDARVNVELLGSADTRSRWSSLAGSRFPR